MVNDILGMDVKEQAFTIGLAMECYEKGLLTKEDCNGLDLSWENVDAVEQLLYKIANREEGIGDLLADGVYKAAQKIGGEAPNFAVYTHKGQCAPCTRRQGNVEHSLFNGSLGYGFQYLQAIWEMSDTCLIQSGPTRWTRNRLFQAT